MEVEIINNLQYLTWKKTIKSYGVEYTSIDKNKNKFILNFYGMVNKIPIKINYYIIIKLSNILNVILFQLLI